MIIDSINAKTETVNVEPYGLLQKICRDLVINRLARLGTGSITVIEKGDATVFGATNTTFPETVTITVAHPDFWTDLTLGGSTGAGESYIRGFWSCNDLVMLVRILLSNREVLDSMDNGATRLRRPVFRLMHWLSRNTRKGSRRNIEAHYDIGNELFSLFLDPSMMYSCAYYQDPAQSLDDAAVSKLERICRKLKLTPQDHVVEIGTGWGGFALYAAKRYGCRVTTTTISRQQYELATQRVIEAGLEDRVTVLMKDYRDLTGEYDKLVSIEMIEAIGHQYLETYFKQCSRLLKPEGMMVLQAITIADRHYEKALREVDFIKKFIFPGGFLPSISAMCSSVANVTDMKLLHLEDIGSHYARTLSDWRTRFFHQIENVRHLGYSENFIRMWEFYFCYCEGAFIERDIGTVQIALAKPGCRHEPEL